VVVATPGQDAAVEIRLQPGLHVFGRALDDTGSPAEGVIVWAWGPGTVILTGTVIDFSGEKLSGVCVRPKLIRSLTALSPDRSSRASNTVTTDISSCTNSYPESI